MPNRRSQAGIRLQSLLAANRLSMKPPWKPLGCAMAIHPDANSMVSLEPKLTVCALNAMMLESKTAAQV